MGQPVIKNRIMAKGSGFFRSLYSRNFRLFFAGQGISITGTWIQRVALPWLVYRESGSTMMLGLVAFAGLAPSFILAPYAGVLIDRWDRFRVVTGAQVFSLVQAFILAYICFKGNTSMLPVILLNIFSGIINAFEMPARQVFMFEIIENKDDYCNAAALNSMVVNGARIAGPSIAAVLICSGGPALCFLINGLSFAAVIISLMMIKTPPVKTKTKKTGLLHDMYEGFYYVFRYKSLRNMLLLYGLLCFAAWPVTVLLPAVAVDMLHGSPAAFSMLMGSSGAGALTGAIILGRRKNMEDVNLLFVKSAALLGLSIFLLSQSSSILLSMGLMAVNGACMMLLMASTVSLIHSMVHENRRGRVMSIYTMIFSGAAPAGSYAAGWLGSSIGISLTLMISGMFCVTAVFIYTAVMPGRSQQFKSIKNTSSTMNALY